MKIDHFSFCIQLFLTYDPKRNQTFDELILMLTNRFERGKKLKIKENK